MRSLASAIEAIPDVETFGRVKSVRGLLIEIGGPAEALRVGGRVTIETAAGALLDCEMVGFRDRHALCLPFQRNSHCICQPDPSHLLKYLQPLVLFEIW